MNLENNQSNVLVVDVEQEYVDGLLINWDLDDNGKYGFMEKDFVDSVINYLPEYTTGFNTKSMDPNKIIPHLRESAKNVVKIKNVDVIKGYIDSKTPYDQWDEDALRTYKSKGIFSELILHFILREIKNTIPLISKIYFKDSIATEAHGFDAVHVRSDELWLGETKFYTKGKQGVDALIDDLNKHFKHDYLKEQFIIIGHSIIKNPETEKWIAKISAAQRLDEKFKMIRIPLLCIYEDCISSDIIDAINSSQDYKTKYLKHVSEMKEYFDTNNTFPNRDKVQIILLLLPVQSKKRIVSDILSRIYNMQNI